MENYLQVLEESLAKKIKVLEQIEEQNRLQEQILQAEEPSMDDFEVSIDKKAALAEELNKLDTGFEALYDRVRVQLLQEKERYKKQILTLQKLIEEITQKSVRIQAQEARNKRLAEGYFSKTKKELKQGRVNSKAALGYYRSTNKSNYVMPQFMDQKK